MAKFTKKKCRIELNTVINKKLDTLEDNSLSKIFQPKDSTQLEFYNIVNEAVLEEEKSLKNTNNKYSEKKLENVKVSNISVGGAGRGSFGVVFIWCSLFVLFVYIVLKIIN